MYFLRSQAALSDGGVGMKGEVFPVEGYRATIEARVDSHYANHVVSLGTIVELFGVAGGKLAMMLDGDAGFMRAFEAMEFVAPAYEGDYIRVTATLLSVGRTSRRRKYEAHVVARTYGIGSAPSHGEVFKEPILIAHAIGTTVTPLELQRLTPAAARRQAPTNRARNNQARKNQARDNQARDK
jgi:3-aminobutyryl-CoA ammonia-lyase